GRIDIVDFIGEVPKIATLVIGFRIPIESELELRIFVVVAWCGEVDERVTPLRILHTPHLSEAELVAVEIERPLHVAHAHHGSEFPHDKPLACYASMLAHPLARQ